VELPDAESRTFDDDSSDYVIAHAVLHHWNSPHRALIEMYRVARKGAIGIEARDSVLMRLFERFRLTSGLRAHGGLHEWQPVRRGSKQHRPGIQKTLDWYLAIEAWWRGVMDGSYREWMRRWYGVHP
jgi:ubiquinone/menaquinone biosynthesis C-methylase UbiE